jgi:hypothetical protein
MKVRSRARAKNAFFLTLSHPKKLKSNIQYCLRHHHHHHQQQQQQQPQQKQQQCKCDLTHNSIATPPLSPQKRERERKREREI